MLPLRPTRTLAEAVVAAGELQPGRSRAAALDEEVRGRRSGASVLMLVVIDDDVIARGIVRAGDVGRRREAAGGGQVGDERAWYRHAGSPLGQLELSARRRRSRRGSSHEVVESRWTKVAGEVCDCAGR